MADISLNGAKAAMSETPKQNKGMRVLMRKNPDRVREISSKGGKASHALGRAHEWDGKEAQEAGRKGGLARAANRRKATGVGIVGAFVFALVTGFCVTGRTVSAQEMFLAQSVTLAWDASPPSEDVVVLYVMFWGTASGVYSQAQEVPATQTQTTVTGLVPGVRYYFAVRAVAKSGLQSGYSNEVNVTLSGNEPPPDPTPLRIPSHIGVTPRMPATIR